MVFVNKITLFLFVLISFFSFSQSKKKELSILRDGVEDSKAEFTVLINTFSNSKVKINKGKKNGFSIINMDSISSIEIIIEEDTLDFNSYLGSMFSGMPESFINEYKEKYKKSFIDSPKEWVLYIDKYPYEVVNNINHKEFIDEDYNGDNSYVVYQLKNQNSACIGIQHFPKD